MLCKLGLVILPSKAQFFVTPIQWEKCDFSQLLPHPKKLSSFNLHFHRIVFQWVWWLFQFFLVL